MTSLKTDSSFTSPSIPHFVYHLVYLMNRKYSSLIIFYLYLYTHFFSLINRLFKCLADWYIFIFLRLSCYIYYGKCGLYIFYFLFTDITNIRRYYVSLLEYVNSFRQYIWKQMYFLINKWKMFYTVARISDFKK